MFKESHHVRVYSEAVGLKGSQDSANLNPLLQSRLNEDLHLPKIANSDERSTKIDNKNITEFEDEPAFASSFALQGNRIL